MNNSTTYQQNSSPGCLLQILYFLVIGWWLGGAWVIAAWLLMITIVGLPVGAAMLNNVPQVMALRGRRVVQVNAQGQTSNAPELSLLIRAPYFLLIGWWLSGLWLSLAYACAMSIIGLPIGFWMFDLAPGIATLKRV
ncbi:MAG TPA: YccF domain-containing protein [Thermoflexales bacterium]|nr:YccF domain-containing protein [Thermoflexales bacterium]HQW35722.1 YccF domain-containing protein [Thermoflexales bacterium]HQZ22611.1 YccF domain-containing protein [Thermoflexales bacterium]HQZ98925.1 YccF domain-containing protein [Thermoflexales bacterium]